MAKRGKSDENEGAAKAAPSRYPVAIHDFRDPAAYKTPKSISRWRWEFLRRSERYQRFADIHGWDQNRGPHASCREFGLRRYYDYRMPYQLGMAFEPGYWVKLPTLDDLSLWKARPNFDAERSLRNLVGTLTELQADGSTIVVVDRSLPLAMQFERVKQQLMDEAEFTKERPVFSRERPADWVKYLRVLDGHAAGVSLDDIASVVYPNAANEYPDFPGRKAVSAALRRAREMQESFARSRFSQAQEK